MPWFPNAYLVEVLQTLTSFAATFILIWWLYDTARDLAVQSVFDRRDRRGTIAYANMHRACFRLLKALVLAGAGIASLFLPPPPPVACGALITPELELNSMIVRGAIIAVTILILVDASVERYFRTKYARHPEDRRR